jgi:hypothetical protein
MGISRPIVDGKCGLEWLTAPCFCACADCARSASCMRWLWAGLVRRLSRAVGRGACRPSTASSSRGRGWRQIIRPPSASVIRAGPSLKHSSPGFAGGLELECKTIYWLSGESLVRACTGYPVDCCAENVHAIACKPAAPARRAWKKETSTQGGCGGCFFAVLFISSMDVMQNCKGSLSRDKFLF